MSDSDDAKKVIVVDLQMPFFSIVVLMVKWALASTRHHLQHGYRRDGRLVVAENLNP